MRLTEHFTLAEFTHSQTASRKGIDNTPDDQQVQAMQALCWHILEPLRGQLGRPVIVSSGYRCNELNTLVGGSKHSQHCQGEAADIYVPNMSARALATAIARLVLPFDQVIYEGSWVHVSYRDTPRGQVLTAHFSSDGVVYRNGIAS